MKLFDSTKIVSDFEENLFLYKLPQDVQTRIENKFQGSKILMLSELVGELDDIHIFWGHKPHLKIIQRFPNLKWIHVGTSGYDKIDLEYCRAKSIQISTSRKENCVAVAEYVVAAILARSRGLLFNRKVDGIDLTIDRSEYDKDLKGLDIASKRSILLLGYGHIGRKIHEYLKSFNSRVVSLNSKEISAFGEKVISPAESHLSNLVPQNFDFVVNTLPLNTTTRGLINANFFRRIAAGTFYISVGRAETTNHEDLISMLRSGYLSGCVLDVHNERDREQLQRMQESFDISITPHIAGLYRSYWLDQEQAFTRNFELFRQGKIFQESFGS